MPLPSLQQCAAAIDRLTPDMLIAAAGSVLVLALAALAVLAMRRASGAARHEVWLLAFAALLILPLLSAALPALHILPHPISIAQSTPPADVIDDGPASPLPAPTPPLPPSTPNNLNITNPIPNSPTPTSPQTPAITPPALSQLTAPASPTPTHFAGLRRLPWTTRLLLLWPLGTLLVLCRVLLGHLSLWSLQRRCTHLTNGELFDLLETLRKELALRRPVQLLTSPTRTMPMTWGLGRARLLVPNDAAAWPPAQRRDVLLHELGHVQRRDCLTQFLSQIACALYWFNPLAWIASRRMQVERERACDDLVLNRGAAAPSYARHLLQSVSSLPPLKLAGVAVAMARPSTLEERMRAILDPTLSRRGMTARGSLATILLLLSALLPVAALKAQQAPPNAPPPDRDSAQPTQYRRGGGSVDSPATRPTSRPAQGGRAGGRGGFVAFGDPPTPVLGEGPTCTFDATIYDVRLPTDQIGKLDIDALAKASESTNEFEKVLAALGETKPIYRANQSIRLAGDSLTINSTVPVVTSQTMTAAGQMVSNYAYHSVGARFTLAGKTVSTGKPELDLSIQIAALSETGVTVSPGVTVPVIRTTALSRKGPFEAHKPFLVVSVDASSPDKDGKAVAYIARIALGEPQSSASK